MIPIIIGTSMTRIRKPLAYWFLTRKCRYETGTLILDDCLIFNTKKVAYLGGELTDPLEELLRIKLMEEFTLEQLEKLVESDAELKTSIRITLVTYNYYQNECSLLTDAKIYWPLVLTSGFTLMHQFAEAFNLRQEKIMRHVKDNQYAIHRH